MKSIPVKIKLFDKSLPLPEYKTAGAAGLDLYSRLDIEVAPKTFEYIPLNVALQFDKGYFGMLLARSSLHKMGLLSLNSVGVMDSDFCGDEDEYKFIAYNFTDQVVSIKKGDRIAQIIILPITQVSLTQVDSLDAKSRGGFGTTGV